ncbi:hypothetical protein KCU73_g13031, partial [Aureobasidium melanogenum]
MQPNNQTSDDKHDQGIHPSARVKHHDFLIAAKDQPQRKGTQNIRNARANDVANGKRRPMLQNAYNDNSKFLPLGACGDGMVDEFVGAEFEDKQGANETCYIRDTAEEGDVLFFNNTRNANAAGWVSVIEKNCGEASATNTFPNADIVMNDAPFAAELYGAWDFSPLVFEAIVLIATGSDTSFCTEKP